MLHFTTEKWERRNPVTRRVEMVAKRLNTGWWLEVHENGQQLVNELADTRGEAMRKAEAVPPFEPYDWRRHPMEPEACGEAWIKQHRAGLALYLVRWDATETRAATGWLWCVTSPDDPCEWCMDYDEGEASTFDEAKAAVEATWARGPVAWEIRREMSDEEWEDFEAHRLGRGLANG